MNGGKGFSGRRSTRITTDILIEVQGEGFAYAGQTVTVNVHGALIRTSAPLKLGDQITLHVHLTGQSTIATVVFAIEELSHFGIELDHAENIWGILATPDDWNAPPQTDRRC